MVTEDLFNVENIISSHMYKGVIYNLFKLEGNIGWSAHIEGNPYGNFIGDSEGWYKSGLPISAEDVSHENAKQSIDIILKK